MGLFVPRMLLFPPKLVYIICKCNQAVWLQVWKQPSCKMGLLRIISPSTALLRASKWALALPWQCWRWLRYEARPGFFCCCFFPFSFICSVSRRFPSNKHGRSCNLRTGSAPFLPAQAWILGSSVLLPGDSITLLFMTQRRKRVTLRVIKGSPDSRNAFLLHIQTIVLEQQLLFCPSLLGSS